MSDLIDRQMVIDGLSELVSQLKFVQGDLGGAVSGVREYIKILPSVEPEQTVKVNKKQAPDKLYYFYCGNCGEMIDCSSYKDYTSIKSYCPYCGTKLNWNDDE